MARKATGRSKRSRSTTQSKTSRPARKTSKRATARPKTAGSRKRTAKPGKGSDFGIPASKRAAAAAVAQEAKFRPAGSHREDPRQPRSGVESRVAGVGKRDAGPASDSGGDVDADIIGVGTGGAGVSQSGPDDLDFREAEERDEEDEFGGGPRQSIE